MGSSKYFQQLANRCNVIANEIKDSDGFVSVARLVERFKARLLVRPLLVEGMLASSEALPNDAGGEARHQWCLLLDRETHDVSENEIAGEAFGSPLSARLRNTVAHELAHSLAFRSTEFGVVLPRRFTSDKTRKEFVESIERDTEKLSPLLLLSDAMLDRMFLPDKDRVSIQELCDAMRAAGVSRYVFVNRLNLLDLVDPHRIKSRPSLTNFAVGIGAWVSGNEATLNSWPLYSNFHGGRVPGFVFQLQKRVPLAANNVFSDSKFHLCGGLSNSTECVVPAGTPRNPSTINLPVRCSVEVGSRKAGSEFLFIIQSLETS